MKHTISIVTIICILLTISCKKSKPGGGNTGTMSPNKSLTSFVFKAADNAGLTADIAGVISNDSVNISLPYGINITSLKPTVQHTGISVTPASGAVQNFSSPVTYVVTAEDGSTKSYRVFVKITTKSTVYIGSADGKLYAFDGDNGTLKWTYSTGGIIGTASPAYYNGTVFVGSGDGFLHAVDAITGVFKWKYDAHGNMGSSTPTLNNGILYFGSGSWPGVCYLTALNGTNGNRIWEQTNASFFASPTFYNGIVYAGGINGLDGYSAVDGSHAILFTNDISNGNPSVANNVLYAGIENAIVQSYNAATGAIKWTFTDATGGSATAGSHSSPTLYNGSVYNPSYLRYIYAIDSATGAFRWRFDAGPNSGYFSPATVANGIVYAVNTDTHIYALDASNGSLRWKFTNGQAYIGSPTPLNNCTVKDDLVYFGSYDKKVYALNATTGAVKWQYTTGGVMSGGACIVAENGAVYYPGISGEHQ